MMTFRLVHGATLRGLLDGKVVEQRISGKWVAFGDPTLALTALAKAEADLTEEVFRLQPDRVSKEEAKVALADLHLVHFTTGEKQWDLLRRFIEEQP